VNRQHQQCAFVDNIVDCALPQGWERANFDPSGSRYCPFDYEWIQSVDCLVGEQAGFAQTDMTSQAQSEAGRRDMSGVLILIVAAFAGLVIVLLGLFAKRLLGKGKIGK
jgi:hypothetical protein